MNTNEGSKELQCVRKKFAKGKAGDSWFTERDQRRTFLPMGDRKDKMVKLEREKKECEEKKSQRL